MKIDTIFYVSENPIEVTHSSLQTKHRLDTAINTLILFTDVAYRISIMMSILMMFATLGGVIYTLVIFALKKPVEGYTTTMLVLTGSFFGVFAILAIIIKYLSILVDLNFKKQKYIIESIERITAI